MEAVTPPIVFLSDFGLRDHYVGQVKAVIASIAPGSAIIDLSHEIEPFAIDEGAWMLEASVRTLPEDAVVLAVVDPGVGSERRAMVARVGNRRFIGPDNGLLSCVASDTARHECRATGEWKVEGDVEVREICQPALWRHPVSPTFHGRDIFAPTAAHVAMGYDIRRLGPPVRTMRVLPPFAGNHPEQGRITGLVVHVDRFGNLITTIRAAELFPAFEVHVGEEIVDRHVRTFADVEPGRSICHIDSTGFLAIACRDDSAAACFDAKRGDPVTVVAR